MIQFSNFCKYPSLFQSMLEHGTHIEKNLFLILQINTAVRSLSRFAPAKGQSLMQLQLVYFLMMPCIISMGRGKMMVEFFSAEMVFSVCR